MGNRSNPWHHGRRRSGITYKDGSPLPLNAFKDHVSYSDGRLEFASFSSMLGIMFKKTSRVYQSDGSFCFKFHEFVGGVTPTAYINIDGEFYQITSLREIIIEKAEQFAQNGKIKMLRNDRDEIFG